MSVFRPSQPYRPFVTISGDLPGGRGRMMFALHLIAVWLLFNALVVAMMERAGTRTVTAL